MSLYAVVLVCALSSPCSEETSIREVIAPSPAPNEHACFLTADLMRAKTPLGPGEIARAFCRYVPEAGGSLFGGRAVGPAPSIGHSGHPGVGGSAQHGN